MKSKLSISLSGNAVQLVTYAGSMFMYNTEPNTSATIERIIQEWAKDRGIEVRVTVEVVTNE